MGSHSSMMQSVSASPSRPPQESVRQDTKRSSPNRSPMRHAGDFDAFSCTFSVRCMFGWLSDSVSTAAARSSSAQTSCRQTRSASLVSTAPQIDGARASA